MLIDEVEQEDYYFVQLLELQDFLVHSKQKKHYLKMKRKFNDIQDFLVLLLIDFGLYST